MLRHLKSNQKYFITILVIVITGLSTIIGKFNSSDMNSVSPQKEPQEITASKPSNQEPINLNRNSEDKLTEDYKSISSTKNNLNLSSISLDKTIMWFCAGAFGYAAVYAIGKSISNK